MLMCAQYLYLSHTHIRCMVFQVVHFAFVDVDFKLKVYVWLSSGRFNGNKICQSQLIKMETEYGRQPAQKSFTEQYFELQDVDCQSHLSERETEK